VEPAVREREVVNVDNGDAKTWDFDTYDWLDTYDEFMRASARLHYDEVLRMLPAVADARPGEDVLDIGVGTGNSAAPFLDVGCTVLGIDPSERMLQKAEEKISGYAGRFCVRRMADPFLHLPLDDKGFDIVVAAYAIHHIDDVAKREAVTGMGASLRPGGRIVIADTMFRDHAHKEEALMQHVGMEDEYQPLLCTFPAMFEAVGLRVTLTQVGELVWVVVAR
jgi:putative AdoMet-dependent methyltransferase